MYVDVVLPVPLPGLFTYTLPDHLVPRAKAGCRVLVPFGTKKVTTGLIVRLHDNPPVAFDVKAVQDVIDDDPVILPAQCDLWQWMADYYLCSIGEVYKAALPGKMKSKKGKTQSQDLSKATTFPLEGGREEELGIALPTLSPAQQDTLTSIHSAWQQHPVCLLHGVTSCGKTEIYIHLIADAIARGQQVLYLLPEIVLTTQLTDRLRAVFADRMAVYHSKFTDAQRADVWHRQLSDTPCPLVVGVRSSVFLPFRHLGLVIVDEEHETNFKQQDPAPRYHARNVAILMAARVGARTLLGTATPSLESYYNARTGKYGLVRLEQRYGSVSLPEVQVVDTADLRRRRLMSGPFSPQLLEHMRTTLDAGDQVILFQNRRGYAPHVQCHVCGWVPRCPHCDVALTLHARVRRMTCHYCGFTTDIPARCPACENPDLRSHGFGTERIEDDIRAHFPQARIARMDLDTTRTRNAYEQLIHDFAQGETDILVGTQMVTKGLDFGRVSLVGVLSADSLLCQPDFRAYERTFQMLTQVAGRAGRRQRQGLVLLQTLSPQLPLIAQVVQDDFLAMYNEQMLERRQFAYPPFTRLITLYLKHRQAAVVDQLAREAVQTLRAQFGTRVLGPDEPPVARIQSLYIRRIILKLEPTLPLQRAKQLLRQTRQQLLQQKNYASAHIYFDVDPL